MDKSSKGYRKANVVELHDAGRVIAEYNYSMEGWFGFYETASDGYIIEGRDIADFCKFFDIQFGELSHYNFKKKKHHYNHLREVDFKISKFRTEIPDCKIEDLWVKIMDPNSISIFFHASFKQEPACNDVIQEMLYSGNFTVWWEEKILEGTDHEKASTANTKSD